METQLFNIEENNNIRDLANTQKTRLARLNSVNSLPIVFFEILTAAFDLVINCTKKHLDSDQSSHSLNLSLSNIISTDSE